MELFLEKEIQNVRVIDSDRNYWFIRSYGGALFDEFKEKGYIGVGFNNIPYEYIKEANFEDTATTKRLKTSLENNYNYKGGEITKWANQLINFEHHVKIDDIVIVPSTDSDQLAIGVVKSNTYLTNVESTFNFNDKNEPYPEKRKRIDWLKIISKSETLGELKNLISSRQAVTNAKMFSDIIEGNLSSVFIKDEKVHLSLLVNQDEDINAYAFKDFLDGMTFIYEEFSKDAGDPIDQNLSIKIKVQSKGRVALIGLSLTGLLGLAGMVALSNNVKLALDIKYIGSIEASGEGFLKSLSDYKDANLERKMKYEAFRDSIERLQVKTVNDTDEQEN